MKKKPKLNPSLPLTLRNYFSHPLKLNARGNLLDACPKVECSGQPTSAGTITVSVCKPVPAKYTLRSYFSSSFRTLTKNCYKTRTRYPIALKFGTKKGGIKAHLGTNFGWNTINRQSVMSDYARKITPICCHAYRVNRVWEEVANRWVNRLTIEPQTFCGLKEIELKTRKIQQQNQQCVTIMQPRLANKKPILATPTR